MKSLDLVSMLKELRSPEEQSRRLCATQMEINVTWDHTKFYGPPQKNAYLLSTAIRNNSGFKTAPRTLVQRHWERAMK